jgi:2-amino-4-hydroxy-6-hydroxymethyldihydropteridine diphosphokinase
MWCGWRIATAAADVNSYLGLGSNVGDRRAYLSAALERIGRITRIEALSHVYETEPVGYHDQPDFWNLVVSVRSDLAPRELLAALKRVEREVGRQPTFAGGPREIDIDLLLHDSTILNEPDVQLPHPRMLGRGFVMIPLAELAPHLAIPGDGRTVRRVVIDGEFERVNRLFPGSELLPRKAE